LRCGLKGNAGFRFGNKICAVVVSFLFKTEVKKALGREVDNKAPMAESRGLHGSVIAEN